MKDAGFNRLKGFFRAFAAINCKTNHDYHFEIELLPSFSTTQDILDYWDKFPTSLFEEKDAWQAVLTKHLNQWLFEFQFYDVRQKGELVQEKLDKHNNFSLSMDIYKEALVEEVIEDFYKLGEFKSCYTIHFGNNQPFYDVNSDDLLLLAQDCSVFVHFGVSD
ncbi:MAG: hypothetical protein F6J87_27540 [Spirulina sp. SIO3F2]|nr:hypothetical protein [Spirulina sp. SIO3F2]